MEMARTGGFQMKRACWGCYGRPDSNISQSLDILERRACLWWPLKSRTLSFDLRDKKSSRNCR